MSAPTGTREGPSPGGRAPGRSSRFDSTRLVRELMVADRGAQAAGEDRVGLASRLLVAVSRGLSQPGSVLVDPSGTSVVAGVGLASDELALLVSTDRRGAAQLSCRAIGERRVYLLGPGTSEPILAALREIRADWSGLAVVPLRDGQTGVGVLLLLASGTPLPAAVMQSLAPAFRLLTLLLHPGRSLTIGTGQALGSLEADDPPIEIEELRRQLAEAREISRSREIEESTAHAARRAEIETLRARVAELEADRVAAGAGIERLEELEADRVGRIREREEYVERIGALEEERRVLIERLARAQTDSVPMAMLPPLDEDGQALGEIAALAAAALAEGGDLGGSEGVGRGVEIADHDAAACGEVGALDASARGGDLVPRDAKETKGPPSQEPADRSLARVGVPAPGEDASPGRPEVPGLAIWQLEADPACEGWAGARAARVGGAYWAGVGEPPRGRRNLLLVNLLDVSVARAVDLARDDGVESVVYGLDRPTGLGFGLGALGWVHRPFDAETTLARIHARAAGRAGGVLIVSAELREIAGLREALAASGCAGSVACDARQATDLLEIVHSPDVVLIDLCLPDGQGLAFACQLRAAPQTCDVPILFLLPETMAAGDLRAAAAAAGVMAPFGDDQAAALLDGRLTSTT